MITPKEKALELINECDIVARDFTRGVSMREFAKAHALNTVDNIVDAINWTTEAKEQLKFWEQVKQEIEKL